MKRFLFISIVLYFVLYIQTVFGSFEIVEILPSTTDDTNLEYITLKNIGDISQNLLGYYLEDASGKKYIFTENIILIVGERRQFFRPETKILLNNTNEVLKLYDENDFLIDEISYETSVKGDFLNFEDIDNIEDGNTSHEIISQESLILGNVFISDEVNISGGASAEQEVEEEDLENTILFPKIQIDLQRPSYVTLGESADNEYYCDSSKEECKINFNFSESFSEEFPEKNYRCEIDFGLGFITDEEEKCNPNTLIFPEGESIIHIKIFHKTNEVYFQEKILKIYNIVENREEVVQVQTSASNSNNIGIFNVHMAPIIIQSGVIQMSDIEYECKKNPCKMNLKYDPMQKDVSCLWYFGEGTASSSTTHTRCNPGTITYELGQHSARLKVYETKNLDNFKIVNFTISNLGKQSLEEDMFDEDEIEDESEEGEVEKQNNLEITRGINIELQGVISENKVFENNTIRCYNVERCSINLIGVVTGETKGLSYIWTLGGEIFSEKLNPAGIWIEKGEHEIVFSVYLNEDKIGEKEIFISIPGKAEKIIQSQEDEDITKNKKEEVTFSPRDMSGIIFGDILPNPAGKDITEFIEIKNTSGDSRNLEGCILTDGSRKYIFPETFLAGGSSQYFFQSQTKIVLGNSKDTLMLSCGENILASISYERKIKDNELLSGEIFPGFTLSEILNLFSESERDETIGQYVKLKFTILKRDGFKITGNTLRNTKLEIFSDDRVILTLYSDAMGELLLKTKNIGAGVYNYDIKISDEFSQYYIKNAGNFEITQAQRNSWFYQKVSVKKVTPPKISQLILADAILEDIEFNNENNTLSLWQKILFYIGLTSVAFLGLVHIFSLSLPKKIKYNVTEIFLTSFATRNRVLVLIG